MSECEDGFIGVRIVNGLHEILRQSTVTSKCGKLPTCSSWLLNGDDFHMCSRIALKSFEKVQKFQDPSSMCNVDSLTCHCKAVCS